MSMTILQRGWCGRAACINAHSMHTQPSLKKVVIAFCLRLGLDPVFAPHIHSVSPHKDRIRLRVVLHCLPQPSCPSQDGISTTCKVLKGHKHMPSLQRASAGHCVSRDACQRGLPSELSWQEITGQLALPCCVLNDRHDTVAVVPMPSNALDSQGNISPSPVIETQDCLPSDKPGKDAKHAQSLRPDLDHFQVCNLELVSRLVQQSGQDSIQGVAVQHSSCTSKLKCLWPITHSQSYE